jgi:biopolymer transport protein ExbB/TolQ
MDFNALLTLGGPVVYILIILSIYATAVIFYKLHIFYKVNFFNNENLNESINLWLLKKQDEAYEKINKADDQQTEGVAFTR